jgi:predicted kinase
MKPQLILLVGPPLSGKDTYIQKEGFQDFVIISRDNILMNLARSNDYSIAFQEVDQKLVDKILLREIYQNIEKNNNVLINMTNLTKKVRKRHLMKFEGYEKTAIVFPKLEIEEYGRRNNKRKVEENKSIPLSVMVSMIDSWEEVSLDEGFDKIIKI